MEQPLALPRRVAWFAPWTWRRRWAVMALLFVFVWYPLSYGPASAMTHTHRMLPWSIYSTVYSPLIWLEGQNQWLDEFCDWYESLFC